MEAQNRDVIHSEFTAVVVGASHLDEASLQTGKFKTLIMANAETTTITLKTNAHFRSRFTQSTKRVISMKGHALSNRYVRPLIQADLRYLLTAFPVREKDRIEVEEACGLPFPVALKATLSSSDNPHVIEVDGSVEGVFGVSDHSDGVGVPWLIASDALVREIRFVLCEAL